MAKVPDDQLPMEERLLRFQERQLAIQEAQLAQATAAQEVQKAQLKQTAPKSNTVAPRCSVFNPRGEKDFPMPELKCEIWCPWLQKPGLHGFDREEVELWNLVEGGEYVVELLDGQMVPLNIVATRNGTTGKVERLAVYGLQDEGGQYGSFYTNERKPVVPPVRQMLRQILGEKADGVLTMRKEVQMIAEGKLEVSVGA